MGSGSGFARKMMAPAREIRSATCAVHSALCTLHSAFCTRRRRLGGDGGQALVEYAIVFPIQLMLTLAIIQLAQIFVAKQVVEYAAFCGARAKLVNLSDDEARAAAVIPLSSICPSDPSDSNDTGSLPNPNAPGPHAFQLVLPGWGNRQPQSSAAELDQLAVDLSGDTARGPAYNRMRTQLSADQALLSQNFNAGQTQYLSGCGIASNSLFTPVNQSETSPLLSGVGWTIQFNYPLRVPIGNVVAYQIGQVFLGMDSELLTTVNNQQCLVMKATCVLPQQPQ
jgi:hypothetical protein